MSQPGNKHYELGVTEAGCEQQVMLCVQTGFCSVPVGGGYTPASYTVGTCTQSVGRLPQTGFLLKVA